MKRLLPFLLVILMAGCLTVSEKGKAVKTWRSSKASLAERFEAVQVLVAKEQSVSSVTELLGPSKSYIRGKTITNPEGKEEELHGVPYAFSDGLILLNFRAAGLPRGNWTFYDADIFPRK